MFGSKKNRSLVDRSEKVLLLDMFTSNLTFLTCYCRKTTAKRGNYMTYSGMSTMVVTPPAAAALVALQNPSQEARPGSFTWTWQSTMPGITTLSPTSSTWNRTNKEPFGVFFLERTHGRQTQILFHAHNLRFFSPLLVFP